MSAKKRKVTIFTNDPYQRGGVFHLNRCVISALRNECDIEVLGHSSIKHYLLRLIRSIDEDYFQTPVSVGSINISHLPIPVRPISHRNFVISTIGSPAFIPFNIKPNVIWASSLYQDEAPPNLSPSKLKWIQKRELTAYQRCPVNFVNSPYSQQRIKNKIGIDTKVLTPPIESFYFKNRKKTIPQRMGCRFISAARFSDRRKNLNLIIESFNRIKGPHDSLTILGSDLSHQIDGIRFLPKLSLEEYRQTLKEHDVFIIGSHQEGFGIAAFEACALGLWIVTTPCGGPEYHLKNRGFISKDFDVESFSQSLRESMVAKQEQLPAELDEEFTFSTFQDRLLSSLNR